MLQRYKASRKLSSAVFLLVPALAAAAAAGAKAYQLAVYYIPFIYINAIATFGFGVALFYATRQAMRLGKCRNPVVGALIGLAAGFAAFIAAHYFDYLANTSHVAGGVPVMEYVQWRVDNGWTIGRSGSALPITGVFVYLVWLIEACIIVGCAALGGASGADEPFCETCGFWANRTVAAFQVQAPADAVAERLRQASSLDELTDPDGWAQGPANTRLTYALLACPACDDFNVLTLTHHADTPGAKGQVETRNTALRENLVLSRDEAALVAALAPLAEATTPAAQQPTTV